ncbi:MAG: VWA domain-containing protein [Halieaceae bacterium]|jgi:Ca-activated chloride channel family protein|nr:VWA domain-containing protein [Halieaceae bacterium]
MLPDPAALEHFHFLRPAWALAFIPWLAITLILNRRETSRSLFGGIIAPHLLEHLRLQRFQSRWLNPVNFTRVISVLLLIVLMGPSWRQQPSPLSQDEAALVILLDVSSSMQQRDIQPSRLERAKQKIGDLLALRPDKKAALIVYAGSAHTVLALTADQDILRQYLAAITPSIMPRAGKFPEYSLPLVEEVLRESNAPATVVLFTDGLGADSIDAFQSWFSTSGDQLLVVGVGTQGQEEGLAPLERRSLKALAGATGGSYLDLTIDDSDVRQLDRRIESHYVIIQDSALPWLDSGYVLVFPAMALFLFWFRRGWTLTWTWLLLPLLLAGNPGPAEAQAESSADTPVQAAAETQEDAGRLRSGLWWFADLWLTADQQGRLLMQAGEYRAAAARFEEPMWKGLAYYYAEDFMLAAEYFSRSDSDDALFDEANARAHARDYVRAANRYDRLLERNPDYPGASRNRQRVQELIDEINRLSESQQAEPGVSGEDKELGSDDAIPAQGAEEITWEQAETVTLTADEILADPGTAEMWLRSVQQDPSNFLAIKFGMQLQRQSGPQRGDQ